MWCDDNGCDRVVVRCYSDAFNCSGGDGGVKDGGGWMTAAMVAQQR